MNAPDLNRRFGGVGRLYGIDGAARIAAAHVAVVGIGGVGSWVAEALARSGIGALTLIDLDMVAESNTNRQIHALDPVYGMAKVDAMAGRIRAIHPGCRLTLVDDFLTPENVAALLTPDLDAVVDAVDQVKAKVAMIVHGRQHRLPVVVAGAAGGQIDPTQVAVADLSQTTQDPLLARVRSQLRKQHGFPRAGGGRFGVEAVFSTEPLRYPEANAACDTGAGPAGLNCAGFGSSICVTATFGLAAAARVLARLAAA